MPTSRNFNLSQSVTNRDENVDDRVANLIVGGANITATYDDAAGTLTIDGQSGYTDTDVGTYLTNNGYDTATNIVATITDSAPATLDTLNELAAALGDDPNFATTTANNIALKLAITDFTSTADTWLGTKSTTDVAEGTNLYYTDARADARIAAATTTDLTEGTNLYYTSARVQAESLGGSLTGTVSDATVQYGTSYSGTPAQGSFFFDSLNQKLKIYTGSAFVDAVPAGGGGGGGGGSSNANATFEKYTYSITGSTNAVSGADDNGDTLSYATGGNQNVEVYVNGVKQVEGASNDYVATTGTSVTFVDNLASGDVVDIQVYELLTNDAFYLKTDTYTKTETNSQISTAVASYLPLAGGTLTGDLVINSDGQFSNGACLQIDNTNSSSSYIKAIEAFAANIPTGSNHQILLGKDSSNNDTATLQFHYAGSASSSNRFGIGFWGADNLLNVLANGDVGIGTTSPNNVSGYQTLHIDGTNGSLIDIGASGKESRIVADDNGLGFQVTPGTHARQNIRWKADQISGVVDSHMLLNSSGNLGIGTASPYKRLTLSSAFGGSAEDLLDLQSSTAGGGTAPKIRFGTWASNANTIGRIGFVDNPNYGGDFVVETNSTGGATDATTEKFRVDKDGTTTVVGTVRSHKGTIQTIVNQPTHYVAINPVNTWAEASSSFRVSITPKYSSGTTILGSFSIPINPQGASNILMAMNPWYSTDGGTTKTLLNQGGPSGSRLPGSHAWFRSSNGYDLNDMQNHIIKFGFVHTSTATLTWGFYFRSEGGNTTYFCHSQGNNGTWGWTAPCYMELREVDY